MRKLHRFAPLWIALISLAISGIVALTTPLPQPQFHDEFSYLLAADTFARGRLTNSPHELWEFFESFQILQQPTYMSKYQPGQGLMLALGKLVTGEPIAGAWISTALACAALWWGLRAFVPNRWATIGALVAATHPLTLNWNWSYWGGAVAVIGGALAVGGIARIARRGGIGAGIMLALGLFILAISRPFEGVVLVVLSRWLMRAPSPRPSPGGRGRKTALATLLACSVMGAGWIGYYNWRVTGSAATLPYLVYESEYAACPPLLWLPRGGDIPSYRHPVMGDYYVNWELPQYERGRSEPLRVGIEKLWSFARAYLASIALVIPLLVLAARRAWLVAVVFTLIVFGNLWFFPHYTAPAVIIYLLIITQGLRYLRALPGGRWIVLTVLTLHLLTAIVWLARLDRSRDGWNYLRTDFIEQAAREDRRLLVIVRPGEGYYPHNDWVYNDADIDASAVAWARDMGEENARLLENFRDRDVLLLEIDANTMRFTDYPR